MPAKPKPKKKSNPNGRPPHITPEVLNKLQEAFAMGCTDIEACLFADIQSRILYKYQEKHPGFIQRKAELKQNPILKARTKVVTEIENDTNTAKWYLERKRKDEFGPEQKIDLTGKITIATPTLSKPEGAGE